MAAASAAIGFVAEGFPAHYWRLKPLLQVICRQFLRNRPQAGGQFPVTRVDAGAGRVAVGKIGPADPLQGGCGGHIALGSRTLFGAAGASVAGALLPFALAFAAGAMLFVIASEIIPETAREETKLATTFALLAGFLVMMSLDIALG